jgi:hypothetical protein
VECRVDSEVPKSKAALVSIGVNLVRVLDLVGDHLMQLASLELHLLLVELVLNHVGAALLTALAGVLLITLVLVIDLAHAH